MNEPYLLLLNLFEDLWLLHYSFFWPLNCSYVGMVFSECKPKIRRCKFKSNWSCQNICTVVFIKAHKKTRQLNSEFKKILIGKAISFFYRNSMNDPYEKFHYLISINVRAIKKFECRLASVCLFKFPRIKQISRLFKILMIFSGFIQDFDKTLPHFNMSNFT